MRRVILGTSRWIAGAVLCTAVAGATVAAFAGSSARGVLPLVFLIVITLVALYFGAAAGVVGSIAAALVFSVFLFPPIGSPLVQDLGERSNVGWMLLGGIAISYLFAPHQTNHPRQE